VLKCHRVSIKQALVYSHSVLAHDMNYKYPGRHCDWMLQRSLYTQEKQVFWWSAWRLWRRARRESNPITRLMTDE